MKGRKPKPTIELRLAGTDRPDRHASRERAPVAPGIPQKPPGLSEDAAWMWTLIETLNQQGAFAEADTAALLACCDLWSKYRTASRLADMDPLDKQACVATRGYFDAWYKSAAVLGLNPLDRLRLRIDKKQEVDPDDEFFQGATA